MYMLYVTHCGEDVSSCTRSHQLHSQLCWGDRRHGSLIVHGLFVGGGFYQGLFGIVYWLPSNMSHSNIKSFYLIWFQVLRASAEPYATAKVTKYIILQSRKVSSVSPSSSILQTYLVQVLWVQSHYWCLLEKKLLTFQSHRIIILTHTNQTTHAAVESKVIYKTWFQPARQLQHPKYSKAIIISKSSLSNSHKLWKPCNCTQ